MPEILKRNEPMVTVKLLVPGVIFDGRSHQQGDSLSVPAKLAAEWREKGWVQPLARIRVLTKNRLVGTKVCQPGDIVEIPSVEQARTMHRQGRADWVNAAEMNERLPARESPGDEKAGLRQVRVLDDFRRIVGMRAEVHTKGSVLFLSDKEAAEVVRKGFCEPVGWEPQKHPNVRFRVAKTFSKGGHTYNVGDIFESDDVDVLTRFMEFLKPFDEPVRKQSKPL